MSDGLLMPEALGDIGEAALDAAENGDLAPLQEELGESVDQDWEYVQSGPLSSMYETFETTFFGQDEPDTQVEEEPDAQAEEEFVASADKGFDPTMGA